LKKKPKKGFAPIGLLDDSKGNLKGSIAKKTKMFKLNDIQFYIDHINRMLFKTKDEWL
jgi:hypothetical protein